MVAVLNECDPSDNPDSDYMSYRIDNWPLSEEIDEDWVRDQPLWDLMQDDPKSAEIMFRDMVSGIENLERHAFKWLQYKIKDTCGDLLQRRIDSGYFEED